MDDGSRLLGGSFGRWLRSLGDSFGKWLWSLRGFFWKMALEVKGILLEDSSGVLGDSSGIKKKMFYSKNTNVD